MEQHLFEVVGGTGAGARIAAAGAETVIGRDPSCDVVLDDPRVSRRHAVVRIADGAAVIADIGSTGGTWVNGTRTAGPVPLAAGDAVRLGDTELLVVWEPQPAAATVAAPAASPPPPAPAADAPPRGRARLVAIPAALLVGVTLVVYGLARARPFEKSAPATPVALGDATRGLAVYQATCAGCHGGQGEGGVGPALAGNPIAVDDAVATIRSGRGVMPAALVTGTDEADVAAYLATILGTGTATPPPATTAPPPPPATTVTTAGDAARGRQVFQATCAGCHGGQGEGGVGPALAGNPVSDEVVAATLRDGRGAMPAGLVTGTDEADVIAYLQTILAR
ncbi:MAG: c-type cytochrome [Actinomycetota bacterium]